ncbi:MAG: hypothetical protein BWX46_00759 [Candidatus Cloacimonetes bacterium ADurb.Bin003]|nr:MAG: hypothetical protein BWX46_00759 [Candidatus Cloacimonetes bacterium ADurb.Bin003]
MGFGKYFIRQIRFSDYHWGVSCVGKFQFSGFQIYYSQKGSYKIGSGGLFTEEIIQVLHYFTCSVVIGRNGSQIGGDNCHSH